MSSSTRSDRQLRYVSAEDAIAIENLKLHSMGISYNEESRDRIREMIKTRKEMDEKKAERRRSEATGFCRKFDGLGMEEEELKMEQSEKIVASGTNNDNGKNAAVKKEKRDAEEEEVEKEDETFVKFAPFKIKLPSDERLQEIGLI